MGNVKRTLLVTVVFGLILAGFAAFVTRDRWQPLWSGARTAEGKAADAESASATGQTEEASVLRLSAQARKNLDLVSKSARPQSYWRTIQVPGLVVDRPGVTDRGVTAPVSGVVQEIRSFPGQTVHGGDVMLTLRIVSEQLLAAQRELFRSTGEAEITRDQLSRLKPLAEQGGISQAKVIELENELRRQETLIRAHWQALLAQGLDQQQIEAAASGDFVTSINLSAPASKPSVSSTNDSATDSDQEAQTHEAPVYEVQGLKVELGEQVDAGQLLVTLADHRMLDIEGHAFKREAPYLESAAEHAWPITVEFAEDDGDHWPSLNQTFEIRYLANMIDGSSRTFDFYLPLRNQSRTFTKDGKTFLVWRFRPGQRVRLHVPVEELHDVYVLPTEGVVREGPEAYVFQQNGDLFNRIPVTIVHEDRMHTVIANDRSITPGLYLAQNAAASLNRVLKSQAASGMPADVHVHADGTVHASH